MRMGGRNDMATEDVVPRRSAFRRMIVVVVRSFVLVLLGLATLIFLFQEKMIYHPRPYKDGDVRRLAGLEVEEIRYDRGGSTGVAFYLPPRNGEEPSKIWLVCGGNAARSLEYAPVTKEWDDGWGYLFVDYPGYGACEGKLSPAAIDAGVDLAIEGLRERSEAPLSVLGHSIGCAVVLRAAVRHGVEELVLVSPFTSMMAMGRRIVGWPLCQLLRHRFDNVEALEALVGGSARVSVFHGVRDLQIPVRMSRELAERFPDLICYNELPEAEHNAIVYDYSQRIGRAMGAMGAMGIK
jgi:pimeloyl-ACP methyl ester carboxylesterase